MKTFRLFALLAMVLGLEACASTHGVADLSGDVATGRALSVQDQELPSAIADFRGERIKAFGLRIKNLEDYFKRCPPGTSPCALAFPAGGRPALRGSAPWMAQITLPERWVDSKLGPIAADNWQERHFCGGTLFAPGWVVTAAHCVDNAMVAEKWRVRVGMSNLALPDGRYYEIDRIICFDPAYCQSKRPEVLYRDDIALVHFNPAPGDLVPARDPSAFDLVGIEAVEITDQAERLQTWSEDGTQRRWDVASGEELARAARPANDVIPALPKVPGTVSGDQTESQIYVRSSRQRLSWGASSENRSGAAADEASSDVLVSDIRREDWRVQRNVLKTDIVRQVRLSPDESYFVMMTGEDCPCIATARDTESLRPRWSIPLTPASGPEDSPLVRRPPQVLEFGERDILLSQGDEVLMVDPASGSIRKRFVHPRSSSWQSQHGGPPDNGQRNIVSAAAISADGKSMVTTTNRYGESDAWLWDVERGALIRRFVHDDPLLSELLAGVALASGGKRIFSWTRYGTFRMLDAASGKQIAIMRQQLPLQEARLLQQDRIAAIFDEAGISNWDVATGAEISRFDHLRTRHGGAVSADERLELSWSGDGTARVWDIGKGSEVLRVYHNGKVNGALFMPDTARVLSWSDDGTARVTRIADRAIDMIFDVGLNPPGSPLALPVSKRPAAGVGVTYLPLARTGVPPKKGSRVDIYGWGKTRQPGGFDPYASLLTVHLTALDNKDCGALPGMEGRHRVHPRVFCAQDGVQKTCKGDSGGPVVQDGVLVGVVSWGKKDCTYDGQPGVYTSIAAYSDWISRTIGEAAGAARAPSDRRLEP